MKAKVILIAFYVAVGVAIAWAIYQLIVVNKVIKDTSPQPAENVK